MRIAAFIAALLIIALARNLGSAPPLDDAPWRPPIYLADAPKPLSYPTATGATSMAVYTPCNITNASSAGSAAVCLTSVPVR